MRYAPDVRERVIGSEPPSCTYMDEMLFSPLRSFKFFVQDLFVSNIIDFTDDPRDVVTPSVVAFGATTAISLGLETDGTAAHGNVRPKANLYSSSVKRF